MNNHGEVPKKAELHNAEGEKIEFNGGSSFRYGGEKIQKWDTEIE